MNQTGPNGGSDKGQGSRGPGRIRNVNGRTGALPALIRTLSSERLFGWVVSQRSSRYLKVRVTCHQGGLTDLDLRKGGSGVKQKLSSTMLEPAN